MDNPEIPDILKESRIDITRDRYSIWIPFIGYTHENFSKNSSEVTYIYPEGRVVFYRKR